MGKTVRKNKAGRGVRRFSGVHRYEKDQLATVRDGSGESVAVRVIGWRRSRTEGKQLVLKVTARKASLPYGARLVRSVACVRARKGGQPKGYLPQVAA